jgi:hypothetical protein
MLTIAWQVTMTHAPLNLLTIRSTEAEAGRGKIFFSQPRQKQPVNLSNGPLSSGKVRSNNSEKLTDQR